MVKCPMVDWDLGEVGSERLLSVLMITTTQTGENVKPLNNIRIGSVKTDERWEGIENATQTIAYLC